MHDKIYGKRFKRLREGKNYSLDFAASGVASKTALYYWEKGQGNMPFGKVVAMLKRMNIKVTELVDDTIGNDTNIDAINAAYINNDDRKLKKIAVKYLTQSRSNPYSRNLLLSAAIACQFLKADTEENLFLPGDVEHLEEILSNTNEWYYEDIFIFGNTLSLLPGRKVVAFTKMLIAKFIDKQDKSDEKWQRAALMTILNAAFALIYDDYQNAQRLLPLIDAIKIKDEFFFERLRLKFALELLHYIDTKDETQIVNNYFSLLDYLGMNHFRTIAKKIFLQIKQIYQIQ